jgi:MarR family transcriptional regulator, organic hydroperoxide resistance regulator
VSNSPVDNPRAPPVGELDLWITLTEFAMNMRIWWVKVCDSLDLTPTQGLLLRQLKFGTPVPMSALADTMACDASNVTGVVDKLESRGLIVRQGAENDRRVKMLVVTEKGRQLQRRLQVLASRSPAAIAALPKAVSQQAGSALRSVLSQWAAEGIRANQAEATEAGKTAKAGSSKDE